MPARDPRATPAPSQDDKALQWDRSEEGTYAAWNLFDGCMWCADDGCQTILSCSEGCFAMLGIQTPPEGAFYWEQFIHLEDRPVVRSRKLTQLTLSGRFDCEYRIQNRAGAILWVRERGLRVTRGETPMLLSALFDLSHIRRLEEKLRLTHERSQMVMEQLSDTIIELDLQTDAIEFSPNWERIFGYQPSAHVSKEDFLLQYVHTDDREQLRDFVRRCRDGEGPLKTEIRFAAQQGYNWCRIQGITQQDEKGRPIKILGIFVDIDSERRIIDGLRDKAERDQLTGLYNKIALQKRIEDYLRTGNPGALCALLIIDVDDFKSVNDTMGHLFGDGVLGEVANGLSHIFHQATVIGRAGGDEFIVFLGDIPSEAWAEEKANDFITLFESMFQDEANRFRITCSVGIAYAPRHGRQFAALYRSADSALYAAKHQGKCCFCIYNDQGTTLGAPPPGRARGRDAAADDGGGYQSFDAYLREYAFDLLSAADDLEAGIGSLLESVGKHYKVSRAYIFEVLETDDAIRNTFEWCDEGVESQMANLQHLSYEEFGDFSQLYIEDGIYYSRDIDRLEEPITDILEPQGIEALLQCAIYDEGRFWGLIGFDDCDGRRLWQKDEVAALRVLAGIVGVFLQKLRLKQQAEDRK